MLTKVVALFCLGLCLSMATEPDLKAWQEFFEHCTLPADGGYIDDGGFCTDFKREKAEDYAMIQAQDNEFLDTIPDQSKLELDSENLEESSSSPPLVASTEGSSSTTPTTTTTPTSTDTPSTDTPSTPVLLEQVEMEGGLHRMMKRHKHKKHHGHHHARVRFAEDPISPDIWPNGNVYYAIATTAATGIVPLKKEMFERTLEAFKQWEQNTCLDFISVAETDASKGLVLFADSSSDRCASPVGFPGTGNKNVVQLQAPGGTKWVKGCPMWTVVHEAGHTAGLKHTHTRQDRNTYVTVGGSANHNYDLAPTTFTDEPLSGTAQEKADEIYDSLEMYYLDGNPDMSIGVGWAVDPLHLTTVEQGLRDAWEKSAGQRKHMGKLDARTINNKYSCFQPSFRDLGATGGTGDKTVWGHSKQTLGQLVDKLAVYVKKDPTALSLYTSEDKTEEHTAQPRDTLLEALTTPITGTSIVTVEIATKKVVLEYGGVSVLLWRIFLSQKHVFFKDSDTLQHVLEVVKYHGGQDFTGKDVSKASTNLDKTKKMSDLGIADGDTLTVAA